MAVMNDKPKVYKSGKCKCGWVTQWYDYASSSHIPPCASCGKVNGFRGHEAMVTATQAEERHAEMIRREQAVAQLRDQWLGRDQKPRAPQFDPRVLLLLVGE